jgi:hypothetical protein
VENLGRAMVSEIGAEALVQLFEDKKCVPACLTYCPTATWIVRDKLPETTRVNLFNCMTFGTVPRECFDILWKLNDVLQML